MIGNAITILIGLFVGVYFWIRHRFSYFRSRGIREDPGYFPLGSKGSWNLLTARVPFANVTDDVYRDNPDVKVVGTYGPFGQPILVVRDLELAKHVLIKDFDHFVDRRPLMASRKANKYFMNMLTSMTGERWKLMRNIMSPVFTSGKLRSMMPIIHNAGDDFCEHLEKLAKSGEEFDAKNMMTSYTLDVIASAGLGVEAKSFKEPNSILRHMIDVLIGANNQDPWGFIRLLMIIGFPRLAKALNVPFINVEASDFIVGIIRSSVQLRKTEKVRKNDLIDILIDALNDYKSSGNNAHFTEEEIETALVSNALLLFFAGFDTSSTGMSLVSYYLLKNPDIQQALYNEIEDAIAQNGGNQKLDYNEIQALPYLDKVVNESLRLYPLTILERFCVKDYKIPGMDFVVPKGMLVQISNTMIMKDPQYFENPEEFNPENFSPEKKTERGPYAFLAFGQGPRNCIGMRFALLQVKTAIVRLVSNYKILPSSKTVAKLEADPYSRSLMPKGGIWMKVQKR